MNIKKYQGGFTLIEMIITIGIFALITTIGFIGYRRVQQNKELAQSNEELVSNIKQVENLSLTGQSIKDELGNLVTPAGGYGIHFDITDDPPKYTLFADTECGDVTEGCNYKYDEGLDKLISVNPYAFFSGVKIKKFDINNYQVISGSGCPLSSVAASSNTALAACPEGGPCTIYGDEADVLDLVFKPPKPQMYLYYYLDNPPDPGDQQGTLESKKIVICLMHERTGNLQSITIQVGPLGKIIIEENKDLAICEG